MKFWTTIAMQRRVRIDGGWTHGNRSNKFKLYGIEGIPADKDVNMEESMLVMCEPTQEDIEALGNAMIIRYKKDIVIAVSPYYCDHGAFFLARNGTTSPNSDGDAVKPDTELIINGKPSFACEGCSRMLRRAAGGCVPGFIQCDHKMFPFLKERDGFIQHPPKALYKPLSKCCVRDHFETYTLENIRTLDAEDMEIIEDQSGKRKCSSQRGATTRMGGSILCPRCMFSEQQTNKLKGITCAAGHSTKYCNGPYFPTDIPEPTLEQRQAIRMMGQPVNTEDYKAARIGRPDWVQTKWRVDPDIVVSIAQYGRSALGIVHTSCTGNNKDAWLLPDEDQEQSYETLRGLGVAIPVVTKPPTLLEKLVCLGLSKGGFDNGIRLSFGGWSALFSVSYCETSDSVEFGYLMRVNKTSFRIYNISDLAVRFPGSTSAVINGSRSYSIKSILELRHTDGWSIPKVKKEVTRILNILGQGSKETVKDLFSQEHPSLTLK